jgi:hypothetical protein
MYKLTVEDCRTGVPPGEWFNLINRAGLRLVMDATLVWYDTRKERLTVEWVDRKGRPCEHHFYLGDDLYEGDALNVLKVKVMMTTC